MPTGFLPLLGACKSAPLLCRWSGILFMIAAVILAASQHVSMIVIGRVFQGIAVSPVCFSHTRITCGSLAINIMQVKTDQALVDLAPYHFVLDSASVESCFAEAAISIPRVPAAADLLCIGISPYLQQVSCCHLVNRSSCYASKLHVPQSPVPIFWLRKSALHV